MTIANSTSLYRHDLQRIARSIRRPTEEDSQYYWIDEEKYERISHFTSDGVPKDALKYWYKSQGLKAFQRLLVERIGENDSTEITVDDAAKLRSQAWNAPEEARDSAADWGTEAHKVIQKAIEAQLDGEVLYDAGDTYNHVLWAFQEFTEQKQIEWLATEAVVWEPPPEGESQWGLLGREHCKVAGSIDAIGRVKNTDKLCVVDWKTCTLDTFKKFGTPYETQYESHAFQVGAYSYYLDQVTPENQSVEIAYVVYFPRTAPPKGKQPFHVRKIDNFERSWDGFETAYKMTKHLEKTHWE
jgi:hypothetical protein